MVDFLKEYDVVCPICSKKAHVRIFEEAKMVLFAPRRLSCGSCGHNREWHSNGVASRFGEEPIDWYFKVPFWHRRPCSGHILWVANREHLEFLKGYVSAKIRSRLRGEHGWSNRSLVGRLPRWISSGRNRTEILRALGEIEALME